MRKSALAERQGKATWWGEAIEANLKELGYGG